MTQTGSGTGEGAPGGRDIRERIVDTAIAMAEETGWDSVSPREVAARLGIPLAELQSHFRDRDAIANAWFARAWQAMLAPMPRDFPARPAQERLHLVIMRWFDALAAHKAVSAQMLGDKIYPSHPHHWVPLIFDLSRTIQWVRDAALLDAGGVRRQVEEVGLTALFLATLALWRRDDTPGQERTRAFLRRRLARADRAMARLWGAAPPPGDPARA